MKKVLKAVIVLIALGAAVQTVVSIARADPHAHQQGGEPGI